MSEAEAPFNTETQRSAAPAEVLGLTRAEWKFTAKAWGFAEVHASTLWYQLYQAGLREFQTSTDCRRASWSEHCATIACTSLR